MKELEKKLNKKEKEEWEESLISSLISLGREYEPDFLARMLIKVLWSLEVWR